MSTPSNSFFETSHTIARRLLVDEGLSVTAVAAQLEAQGYGPQESAYAATGAVRGMLVNIKRERDLSPDEEKVHQEFKQVLSLYERLYDYRPTKVFTIITLILLALVIPTYIYVLITINDQNELADDLRYRGPLVVNFWNDNYEQAELARYFIDESRKDVRNAGYLSTAASFVALLVFSAWMWQLHSNADAFGAEELANHGSVFWKWFMPIAVFWYIPNYLAEIYQTSAEESNLHRRTSTYWQLEDASIFVIVWAIVFFGGRVVGTLLLSSRTVATADDIPDVNAQAATAQYIYMVIIFVTMMLIVSLHARQTQKAEEMRELVHEELNNVQALLHVEAQHVE